MCRAWHTPPWAQAFQPRELSREQRQQLGESCLWAEDKPTSRVLPGNGWALTPFGNSYILSQFLLGRGRYPQTHLAPSLLFTGKEGDSKVRGGLENAYGHCEMKEEGRGQSKFPFFQPHDPGSRANSACLLASDQPQASTSWSHLQSCSRKAGAFQGSLSLKRRETKQGLSP